VLPKHYLFHYPRARPQVDFLRIRPYTPPCVCWTNHHQDAGTQRFSSPQRAPGQLGPIVPHISPPFVWLDLSAVQLSIILSSITSLPSLTAQELLSTMPTASAFTPEQSSHLTIHDTWSEFTVLAVVTGLYERYGAIGLLSLIICDRHTETVDTEPPVNPEALLGSERCLFMCDLAYRALDDNIMWHPVRIYLDRIQLRQLRPDEGRSSCLRDSRCFPNHRGTRTTATSPTTEGTRTTEASPAAESTRTPKKSKKARNLPPLPCLVPVKTEKRRQAHKYLKSHLKDVHGLDPEGVQQYYDRTLSLVCVGVYGTFGRWGGWRSGLIQEYCGPLSGGKVLFRV
jgi:hypothetical protein